MGDVFSILHKGEKLTNVIKEKNQSIILLSSL